MKYSITIPAYKDTYLKECIDSILSQTVSDLELIILNDASPFDIDSIIAIYGDSRVRYYKNEKNVGAVDVVDNWNKCLELAKGDYIICMGDDDRLLPNCLEEYDKLISKYPGLGVYHAWTEIIDEKGNFKRMTSARCEFETVYSLIWHRWIGQRSQYIGDFLFDAKFLRENGGFFKLPLAWASDDITAIIAASETGIANTQVVTFLYRENDQTISNTGNAKVKILALMQEREWYVNFLKKRPEDELDSKFYNDIMERMPFFYEAKAKMTIASDLDNSIFSVFFWIREHNNYCYSIKTVVSALKSKILKFFA